MNPSRFDLALFAVFVVLFATFSVLVVWDLTAFWLARRRVRRRIRAGHVAPESAEAPVKRREAPDDALTRAVTWMPALQRVRLLLDQARIDLTPGMFVVGSTGLALAGGLAAVLLGVGAPGVVAAALVTGSIPWLIAERRRRQRTRRFEAQFPQAIDLLARAARAGHPLTAGITMVADEGMPDVASEFRRVSDEVRFGLPQDEALRGLADRVDLMDVRIFVTAVLIQRESGGNLAEVLDNIAETVRTRFTLRRQLRVHTAQGRLSGYVLALLPFFVAGALYAVNREYVATLAVTSAGKAMVVGALTLELVGFVWIRRILDIEI